MTAVPSMNPLFDDVLEYERWLHDQCQVVEADLSAKHKRMAESRFVFLRATYFRWARTIPQLCPQLMQSPRVPCIGDVHVENYGTWRDADSRLVWGLNDFDECAVMPYTLDLLRLACSAAPVDGVSLRHAEVAQAVLRGYRRGLERPGPVLLTQGPQWYAALAGKLADAAGAFWSRFNEAPAVEPPRRVRHLLRAACPKGATLTKITAIPRGGGSLGRPRYQALATWNGGYLVREAKAAVPSAWGWAIGKSGRSRVEEVAFGPYRAPDPVLRLRHGFIVRRVSPDAHKLELADFDGAKVLRELLDDMGAELASGAPRRQAWRDDRDRPGEAWEKVAGHCNGSGTAPGAKRLRAVDAIPAGVEDDHWTAVNRSTLPRSRPVPHNGDPQVDRKHGRGGVVAGRLNDSCGHEPW
jgi:hypothetical protein